jgi:hypothetical protein
LAAHHLMDALNPAELLQLAERHWCIRGLASKSPTFARARMDDA